MLLARIVGPLAAALAAGLALATPAAADQVSTTCDKKGHNLNAWAYYLDTGTVHQWTSFQYELGGAGTGGESNVDFVVHDGPAVVYWNNSPDDLDNGQMYTVTPPWAVYTAKTSLEWVNFLATFDVFGPDPFCGTNTGSI
jgi:hypothetical protein